MKKVRYLCPSCKSGNIHKVDIHAQKWDEDIQVWYPMPNLYDFTFFYCEDCKESTENEELEETEFFE